MLKLMFKTFYCDQQNKYNQGFCDFLQAPGAWNGVYKILTSDYNA